MNDEKTTQNTNDDSSDNPIEIVELEFPVDFNKQKYTEINFCRRPRARDYFGLKPSKLTFDDIVKIVSSVTGQSKSWLELMDVKDFISMNECLNKFTGDSAKKIADIDICNFPICIPLDYPIKRRGKEIDDIVINRRPIVLDYKGIVLTEMGFQDNITIASNISNRQFDILKEMDVSDMMKVSGLIERFLLNTA